MFVPKHPSFGLYVQGRDVDSSPSSVLSPCRLDYNEHSGVNCAKLGGWRAAQSLDVNPFRQPRAMPVYCMNLPQFSNGFMYVFNEQDLE